MVKFVERSCPLCGTSELGKEIVGLSFDEKVIGRETFSSRKNPDKLHHRMVVCPSCDLAYANPVLDSQWIREQYVGASFLTPIESSHAARNHERLLLRVLRLLPDREEALDIGAGDGAFLSILRNRGFTKLSGVEPSIESIEQSAGSVRHSISNSFFCGSSYEKHQFSLITCFQTLEHVDEIEQLAKSAFRILKPGGLLLVSAHNYRSLSASVLKTRSPIYDIEHLQLFSKKSLSAMLKLSGFKIHRVKIMRSDYPVEYWIRLAPLWSPVKKLLYMTLKNIGVDKCVLPIWAGNIWAYGIKPTTAPIAK